MREHKWSQALKKLWVIEYYLLDSEFDEGPLPMPLPLPVIEEDEYAFIEQSLQRYRDRDYRHIGD